MPQCNTHRLRTAGLILHAGGTHPPTLLDGIVHNTTERDPSQGPSGILNSSQCSYRSFRLSDGFNSLGVQSASQPRCQRANPFRGSWENEQARLCLSCHILGIKNWERPQKKNRREPSCSVHVLGPSEERRVYRLHNAARCVLFKHDNLGKRNGGEQSLYNKDHFSFCEGTTSFKG